MLGRAVELRIGLDMFYYGCQTIPMQKQDVERLMYMNTALLCQNTWADLLKNGSSFTTGTALRMITALKTLKYLLRKITVEKFCVLTAERSLQSDEI